jgi:hypothetical protein
MMHRRYASRAEIRDVEQECRETRRQMDEYAAAHAPLAHKVQLALRAIMTRSLDKKTSRTDLSSAEIATLCDIDATIRPCVEGRAPDLAPDVVLVLATQLSVIADK